MVNWTVDYLKNGSWRKDLTELPLTILSMISAGILIVLFVLFRMMVKKPKVEEKKKRKEKWEMLKKRNNLYSK